jgi:hypothetical protein
MKSVGRREENVSNKDHFSRKNSSELRELCQDFEQTDGKRSDIRPGTIHNSIPNFDDDDGYGRKSASRR